MISIATDSNYRGQGNALKAAQSGLDWYNKYGKKKIDNLHWSAEIDNVGSSTLAKKLGFSEVLEKDRPSWAE